ncbi:MAG: hypothetical protein Q4G34_03225 [Micrococcus sp.]|nr:hypothetical protein [Micrococcus sp.]
MTDPGTSLTAHPVHLWRFPKIFAIFHALDSADDPALAYRELSGPDKALFDAYFLPATYEPSYELTPLDANGHPTGEVQTFDSLDDALSVTTSSTARRCWSAVTTWTGRALMGNALFDTHTEGTWCSQNGRVVSAQFRRSWTTIGAIGWRDAGEIARGSGISGGEARIWAQRRLILGTGGWDIQNKQPCNRLNGGRTGLYSMSERCTTV